MQVGLGFAQNELAFNDRRPTYVQVIPMELDEDADDLAASNAAKAEGIAGSYDDLRAELGL